MRTILSIRLILLWGREEMYRGCHCPTSRSAPPQVCVGCETKGAKEQRHVGKVYSETKSDETAAMADERFRQRRTISRCIARVWSGSRARAEGTRHLWNLGNRMAIDDQKPWYIISSQHRKMQDVESSLYHIGSNKNGGWKHWGKSFKLAGNDSNNLLGMHWNVNRSTEKQQIKAVQMASLNVDRKLPLAMAKLQSPLMQSVMESWNRKLKKPTKSGFLI